MTIAWKRFTTLYLIQFVQLFDFMSIGPIGAIFVEKSLIQSSTIPTSITAYSISAIVGSLFVDRLKQQGAKFSLIVLLLIFSLQYVLLSLMVNDSTFVFARVIGGLTGGLIGSFAYSQLGSAEFTSNAGLWNGRIQTVQSMVTLIGIPACMFAISKLGAQIFFPALFLSSLGLAWYVSKSTITDLRTHGKRTEPISCLLKSHFDIIFTGFFCYLAAFLFITLMPNYILNSRGISQKELSLAYSISGVITLITAGSLGRFNSRVKSEILLTISALTIALPQLLFFKTSNLNLVLYLGVPTYLLISTARAIYQRGIILQKKSHDSVVLHSINNIAIRSGILTSGIILWGLSQYTKSISESFWYSNAASIACGLILVTFITLKTILSEAYLQLRKTANN